MKKLYKVLKNDLTSPYQNFQYEIGKWYVCKNFDENPRKDCSRGFYCGDLESLLYRGLFRGDESVFEVEASGRSVNCGKFKTRYEKQRIIRKVPEEELKELLEEESERLGYNLKEVLFPVNPFKIKPPVITDKHIELLREWAKVRGFITKSVRDFLEPSVWDPIGISVRHSIGNFIEDYSSVDFIEGSIKESIRCSVGSSIYAYISSLFPDIKKWKFCEKLGPKPFESGERLWKMGLVSSFDGEVWRLRGGKRGKILWEGKLL